MGWSRAIEVDKLLQGVDLGERIVALFCGVVALGEAKRLGFDFGGWGGGLSVLRMAVFAFAAASAGAWIGCDRCAGAGWGSGFQSSFFLGAAGRRSSPYCWELRAELVQVFSAFFGWFQGPRVRSRGSRRVQVQ